MSNQVLLVTGASRGIGAATAIKAGKLGYVVCVNYLHNVDAANKVVAEIKTNGGTALAVQADVSQENEVKKLFQQIDEKLGKLSAVVNNVGILDKQMRLDEMSLDRFNHIMLSNVSSVFLCCKEAVKRMSTKYGGQGGCIVNVSSKAAQLGSPGEYIDYAASKAAVDTLTIGLAKEVATEGIRVNGVRPGFIYTDIHALGGDPKRVDKVKGSIPMKRGGTPEEVANATLWLLSAESSFVTGSFIDVSGGR